MLCRKSKTASSTGSAAPAPYDGEEMSGRPRTTSFAEGNKTQNYPVMGGMKIISKYLDPCFMRFTTGGFHNGMIVESGKTWKKNVCFERHIKYSELRLVLKIA